MPYLVLLPKGKFDFFTFASILTKMDLDLNLWTEVSYLSYMKTKLS